MIDVKRLSNISMERISDMGINGEIDPFLSCSYLSCSPEYLRLLNEEDRDFIEGLSSELDRFPLGSDRSLWDEEALSKLDEELIKFRSMFIDRVLVILRKISSKGFVRAISTARSGAGRRTK